MIRKKGRREYTAIRARLNVTCACRPSVADAAYGALAVREGGSRPAGGPVSGDALTAAAPPSEQSVAPPAGREKTQLSNIFREELRSYRSGRIIFRGAEKGLYYSSVFE